MKRATFVLLFSVSLSVAFGQLATPRKIKVFVPTEDSTFNGIGVDKKGKQYEFIMEPTVKKSSTGEITELYQTLYDKNGRRILVEDFKKGKRWDVYLFPDSTTMVQYQLSGEGKIDVETHGMRKDNEFYEFDYGVPTPSYLYEYYSSGQLKYKMEFRTKGGFVSSTKAWNVLEYYYPDGKPFTEWGNLRDGFGSYVILDDAGKVCQTCTEKANKKK